MLNYNINAKEVISFLRIVRPGCIIGKQQKYLEEFYKKYCKKYKRNDSLKFFLKY